MIISFNKALSMSLDTNRIQLEYIWICWCLICQEVWVGLT